MTRRGKRNLIIANAGAAALNLSMFIFLNHRWYSLASAALSLLTLWWVTTLPVKRADRTSFGHWFAPAYWRRRWCLWRGHPMAEWSPIVVYDKAPDRWSGFGNLIIPGQEYVIKAWRCARHDKAPTRKE